MQSSVTQMRKGLVEYCILALLVRSRRYGYELVALLSEVDGLVMSEGTIYPLLSRLRREGLVETEWQESSAGRPRKYYRLTSRGQLALQSFRKDWSVLRSAVDALITEEVEA